MAAKKPKDDYVRNAEVIRVIDGDTVELAVDLGCKITVNMTCRLNGINCPEVKTQEGVEAKEWMQSKLPPFREVVVKTFRGDTTEKYGRYLAEIFLPGETTSLNTQLVKDGRAVVYKC